MRIWMHSGAQTRPWEPWEPWEARRYVREILLREALSLFPREAASSSLEGFDIFDVDEASPDLECPLILKAPESSGHSLPIGPDHGAYVLVGVAGGDANLTRHLHPLALDEEEDEASEPRRHLFEGHVLHPRLIVVKAF